ncbi:MAG: hypothetical protein OEY33_03365, partial [Bdellovibrionales bacterium]|nr:hypothetical protein [Bdellovibrionales bacterium]
MSMSYKVLGETLNFQYLSENPMLLDPTNKIHDLLDEYQKEEDTEKEYSIINKILHQMVDDSELVPLYYYTSPFFYDQNKINISELFTDETFQLWRIRKSDS